MFPKEVIEMEESEASRSVIWQGVLAFYLCEFTEFTPKGMDYESTNQESCNFRFHSDVHHGCSRGTRFGNFSLRRPSGFA